MRTFDWKLNPGTLLKQLMLICHLSYDEVPFNHPYGRKRRKRRARAMLFSLPQPVS